MLVELTNDPRPYSWGDSHSIASWQSQSRPSAPEAELWFGTHSGSPARVKNPHASTEEELASFLVGQGKPAQLPFLVKVLAAAKPLSIQVHPTLSQAQQGYEIENLKGISLEDPRRNYKDASDKPEVMIAWSESFDALVGFQQEHEMHKTLSTIDAAVGDANLTKPLYSALEGGPEALVSWLVHSEEHSIALARAITDSVNSSMSKHADGTVWRVWKSVVPHFPGDPGIVVASFLNLVTLARGEALFVPAGIVHAYLGGFGLEVMAPSDNVVRGGLTDKHLDRAELASLVLRAPYAPGNLRAELVSGVEVFQPPGVPFRILRASPGEGTVAFTAQEPMVIVVEKGAATFSWDRGAGNLRAGHAYLFIPEPGSQVQLAGDASVYFVSGP